MATVVNNTGERGNNAGLIVGLIVLIVFVILLFYYGLPMLQSASSPQVAVPEQVDVNVNTPQN